MKKLVFALMFYLYMSFALSGQADSSGGHRDLVVILDTSASMSGFYGEVRTYITGALLQEFLRIGDTFHLLSFSDKTRLEISRHIEDQRDLEVIIGRMLLLYPLDPYSDIAGALAYTEGYVSSLPGRRPKTILLISDGDPTPPPGSPGMDIPGLQRLIGDMQNRLSLRGIRFEFLRVPGDMNRKPRPAAFPAQPPPVPPSPPTASSAVPPVPRPGGTGGALPPAPPMPAAEPQIQAPSGASALPPLAALQMPILDAESPPLPQAESPPEPVFTEENSPAFPQDQGSEQPVFTEEPADRSPDSGEPLEAAPPVELPGKPTSPWDGDFQEHPVAGARSYLVYINTGFGVLAALSILLSIFLVARRLQNAPNRMLVHGTETPGFEGPPLLSLFVKDQSTSLSRRNLHILKPGYSLSLGGGNSDFLIFLVPVPSCIARIYFDGTLFTLVPQKPRFFPDLDAQVMQDCIGKTIRIITGKHYELYIRIERRGDPWYALNRLLTSITLPG